VERPRIELEPCGPDAAALLPGWLSTPDELFAWAGARFRAPLDTAQLEEHLARTAAPGSGALAFTAVATESGEVLGHGELTAIDAVHGTTVMRRVVIAPSHRRRGLGRALVRALLRTAFHDLALHRVEVRAFTHNLAAVGLYRSVGFSEEGRIREYRVHDGRRLSSHLMGMLEDEWRAQVGLASSAGGSTPAAIA
jgi:RimJ/RimL family protein N-acetyltransferase